MKENEKATETEVLRDLVLLLHKEQVHHRRWRIFTRLLRGAGLFIGALWLVGVAAQSGGLPWLSKPSTNSHVAYINIQGEIVAGGMADADHLIPSIQAAFENPAAKAIVLRINSPGGSPVQAGRIYKEIQAQRKLHPGKKVYAVIDDVGASGGYYVAASADEIYADEASLVGSIGVISASFDFTGLMKKLGIERRAITAGEHKALMDPFAPLSPELRAFWESVLEDTHQQFVARVKAGRGQRLKDDPTLFSGLIWNGEQALELGLVDGLGSLHSVARDVIGEPNLKDYTPTQDIIRRLTHQARLQTTAAFKDLGLIKAH